MSDASGWWSSSRTTRPRCCSNEGWTLHLVTVPAAVAATIERSDPPRRRAETPLKPVFEVVGIEALRERIAELGGELDPPERGRSFGGAVRLDALDPEGNVIQLLRGRPERSMAI